MRESKKQLKNQLRAWVAKQRKRSRTQIQENLEPQFCYNCDMNDKKKKLWTYVKMIDIRITICHIKIIVTIYQVPMANIMCK